MTNEEILKELEKTNREVERLQRQINQMSYKDSDHLSNLMMLDRNFVKRAFAIYGHVFVAGLMISIPLYACFFIFALSSGGF